MHWHARTWSMNSNRQPPFDPPFGPVELCHSYPFQQQTSKFSLKIPQTVSWTWYNLGPSLPVVHNSRAHRFHADGKRGNWFPIHDILSGWQKIKVLSLKFTWRLAHDGIFGGLEEWTSNRYLIQSQRSADLMRHGLVEHGLEVGSQHTFALIQTVDDTRPTNSPDGMLLAPELLEDIL